MIIDSLGYVARTVQGARAKTGTNNSVKRNWFFIKHCSNRIDGYVHLRYVRFPSHLIGKKVRFKVEIIKDSAEAQK